MRVVLGDVAYLSDAVLAGEGDGILPAQLEAVVVLGVVGGGDHGATWLLEVPDREVQRVGRDEPQVQHVRASLRDAFNEGLHQSLPAQPHVAGDDDSGPRDAEVGHEGAPDVPGHVLVQAIRVHAPDVVGLEYRLVDHVSLLPLGTVRLASGTIASRGPSCRPGRVAPGAAYHGTTIRHLRGPLLRRPYRRGGVVGRPAGVRPPASRGLRSPEPRPGGPDPARHRLRRASRLPAPARPTRDSRGTRASPRRRRRP